MRWAMLAIFIVAALWSVQVAACEFQDGKAGISPLRSKRPVLGEDVRLTSGFGVRFHPVFNEARMHKGVDWAAPRGTPVIAAAGGRVVEAAIKGPYGNTVVMDHGGGWLTLYGQLAAFVVKEGDCIAFGTVIGRVGSTGVAMGPHLHFELLRDGEPINPLPTSIETQATGGD